MIDIFQSVLLGIGIVAGSIALLFAVEWWWTTDERRQHNDVVGWQLSVVGMIYAVIVGFMLYAVWGDFEAARVNADAEADALVSVARLAAGLPQPQRDRIQADAVRYANVMIHDEWPAMIHEETSRDGIDVTEDLWTAATQPETVSSTQQTVLDATITALTEMTRHRRLRESQSRARLPRILWAVLAVGAFITLSSCCLFGSKSFSLHLLQVLGLSVLVALALIAIAQIDSPFQGTVHVPPNAFIRALSSLPAPALHP